MDMVRKVLLVLNGQNEAITMRHIVYHTGFTPSTLVGIMMGMINQGYITEILPADMKGNRGISRCTCACCIPKNSQENGLSTSLDRRLYRICEKGTVYLLNWGIVPEK